MKIKRFIFLAFLFFLFPKPSYAYIDPGTGSYLFQILIASSLGALFFVKSSWQKIKHFINKSASKEDLIKKDINLNNEDK